MRTPSFQKAFVAVAASLLALLFVADAEAGGKRCRSRCVSNPYYAPAACEYTAPGCGYPVPTCGCAGMVGGMGGGYSLTARPNAVTTAAIPCFLGLKQVTANNTTDTFVFNIAIPFSFTRVDLAFNFNGAQVAKVENAVLNGMTASYTYDAANERLTVRGPVASTVGTHGYGTADITITVTDAAGGTPFPDWSKVCLSW